MADTEEALKLLRLISQASTAVQILTEGRIVKLDYQEQMEHKRVFGRGMCVGDFVIFNRVDFTDPHHDP